MAEDPISIGVASRPHPSETVNGDASAIHWWEGACRIAVIDGLGHGILAAEASARAVAVLDEYPALDPAEAIRRCHGALMGTRGAAISIARLDVARGELTYAGIGNVEGHLWHGARRERLISYRGIVGSVIRTIRPFTLSLTEEWAFLMHSDGISARVDLRALGLAPPHSPTELAQAALEQFGRQQDDALAVVALPAT